MAAGTSRRSFVTGRESTEDASARKDLLAAILTLLSSARSGSRRGRRFQEGRTFLMASASLRLSRASAWRSSHGGGKCAAQFRQVTEVRQSQGRDPRNCASVGLRSMSKKP
jgi:hypothetical protein